MWPSPSPLVFYLVRPPGGIQGSQHLPSLGLFHSKCSSGASGIMGSLLQKQNLRPTPDLLSHSLYFHRTSKQFKGTLMFEGKKKRLELLPWSPWTPAFPRLLHSPGRSTDQDSGTRALEIFAWCQQILGHFSEVTLSEGHHSQKLVLHPSVTVLQQIMSAQ